MTGRAETEKKCGAASLLLWFWWMIVLEDLPCLIDRPDGRFKIFFGDLIQYLAEPGMILEAVEFIVFFPQGSQLQPDDPFVACIGSLDKSSAGFQLSDQLGDTGTGSAQKVADVADLDPGFCGRISTCREILFRLQFVDRLERLDMTRRQSLRQFRESSDEMLHLMAGIEKITYFL